MNMLSTIGGMLPVALLLLAAGGAALAWPLLVTRQERSDLKRRLRVDPLPSKGEEPGARPQKGNVVREKAARTAQEFYARTDPENVARLRLKLIQAGYMDVRAVGMFFLVRFV